ncbi:MAG: protein kinase [Burkholderiales bacterium]|nr:protein kinase [Burkholderiales bacterium]
MLDIEKLGRYDIVRVLGRGAMGVVYEARDPNLDRKVAIKTVRVQSLSAEAASEYEIRFRTEARSAARLHHPNIVSVFDSGQDGDEAYLVMEFIEGEDLKHHLECGARFSVRSAIVMVHDLLMALDHAHRQNVVHRDIKPANMLIEVTGRVKLTDFGVARIQEPDESHLTQVGGAVGTPKYMSPEQAKGQRGDSRSDVFSAGVVLYELLTGKLPFDGDNQFVIIHQIVSSDPTPPSALNPDVPPGMDAVMARALAKDPNERYATARDFALALRGVAQQLPPSSGTPITPVTADIGSSQAVPIVIAAADAVLRDGSSTGIFGPEADISQGATVNHEAELSAWSVVKDSTEQQEYVHFLERFPSGIYAKRAQRELDLLVARSRFDADSTVNPYPSTLPMDPDLLDITQQPVATTAASVPEASASRGGYGKWLLLGLGGVACAVAAVVYLRAPASAPESTSAQVSAQAPTKVAQAQAEEVIEPARPGASVPASEVAASRPAASTVPATGPASAASRPGRAKPAVAMTASASAPVAAAAPATTATPVSASQPESARHPAPVASGPGPVRGVGPSAPGQVCADRVFIFRIACVAEQCTTDRYRDTPECVRFREMERIREEQRARRLSQ